jgi:hypothetical protein
MKLLISAGKDPARVEEYFKSELEILRKHGYEYIVKEGGLDVALMSSKASISGFKHVQEELLNMVRGLCRCRAGWGSEKLHEGALLLAYEGEGNEVKEVLEKAGRLWDVHKLSSRQDVKGFFPS